MIRDGWLVECPAAGDFPNAAEDLRHEALFLLFALVMGLKFLRPRR